MYLFPLILTRVCAIEVSFTLFTVIFAWFPIWSQMKFWGLWGNIQGCSRYATAYNCCSSWSTCWALRDYQIIIILNIFLKFFIITTHEYLSSNHILWIENITSGNSFGRIPGDKFQFNSHCHLTIHHPSIIPLEAQKNPLFQLSQQHQSTASFHLHLSFSNK